jgi:hypothetical protein
MRNFFFCVVIFLFLCLLTFGYCKTYEAAEHYRNQQTITGEDGYLSENDKQ